MKGEGFLYSEGCDKGPANAWITTGGQISVRGHTIEIRSSQQVTAEASPVGSEDYYLRCCAMILGEGKQADMERAKNMMAAGQMQGQDAAQVGMSALANWATRPSTAISYDSYYNEATTLGAITRAPLSIEQLMATMTKPAHDQTTAPDSKQPAQGPEEAEERGWQQARPPSQQYRPSNSNQQARQTQPGTQGGNPQQWQNREREQTPPAMAEPAAGKQQRPSHERSWILQPAGKQYQVYPHQHTTNKLAYPHTLQSHKQTNAKCHQTICK